MVNKMLISLVAVLFGMMSFGFISANDGDYTPVPQSPDTRVAYLGQIVQENGSLMLDADFIEWYEGEAADRVFREQEQDPEMTEAPDGYYIVNPDNTIEKLPVAADAKVFMQLYNRTGDPAEADIRWNEQISLDKFRALLAEDGELDIKQFPYHLTMENGVITKIVQQYVP
ncbi:hypothetical protein [Cohnella boryungensis]|jgi:hypothetical protein|uniref:Copper amine oxidase-like N-terminal domain-containing protein n=1 Tax=Cohnella boryungensis TaxID=768479 RepID=A0ABV8SJ62_9BACL